MTAALILRWVVGHWREVAIAAVVVGIGLLAVSWMGRGDKIENLKAKIDVIEARAEQERAQYAANIKVYENELARQNAAVEALGAAAVAARERADRERQVALARIRERQAEEMQSINREMADLRSRINGMKPGDACLEAMRELGR